MKKLMNKLRAWANGNTLKMIAVFLGFVGIVGAAGAIVTALLTQFTGIPYVYGVVGTAITIMGGWIATVKLTE